MIVTSTNTIPKVLAYDVAIFGGGPAGITLATSLAQRGASVALFEAGGLEVTSDRSSYEGITSLYSPQGDLIHRDPSYMRVSRLRGLGGTSNHWSNWCRPMDEIDFLSRPWLPNSGWPILREELDSYYVSAADLCEVPPFEAPPYRDEGYQFGTSGYFVSRSYHINPTPVRFARKFHSELSTSVNVSVFLDAPILSVKTNSARSRIEYAEIGRQGEMKRVFAKNYVLACGGIENARLLLNWNSDPKTGLRDPNGLVGRFFSEDFHIMVGQILLQDLKSELKRRYDTTKGGTEALVVHLTPKIQNREQLLNLQVDLDPLAIHDLSDMANNLSRLRASQEKPLSPHGLRFIFAPAPNPESRVLLREDRDSSGLRKADLKIQFTEHESRSIERSLELLAAELGVAWRGRVGQNFAATQLFHTANFGTSLRYYGYHHNGTTRMAEHPSDGVTNRDGRLFEIENLFALGSSLFPVSGHAPPTLTIVALALRMADYLTREGS